MFNRPFFLMLINGCVQVDRSHTLTLEEPKNGSSLQSIDNKNYSLKYLIYSPETMGLSSFFADLSAGRFKQAFMDEGLDYTPSKTDNEALQKMIEYGFIPVWAEFTNYSDKSLTVDPKSTVLSDGTLKAVALNPKAIPKAFEEFNVNAVGANFWNLTVVIGASALLVAILAREGGGFRGSDFNPGIYNGSLESNQESLIWNSTEKTTHIDFNDLLFPFSTKIKPGGILKGIVFFRGKGLEISNSLILSSEPHLTIVK